VHAHPDGHDLDRAPHAPSQIGSCCKATESTLSHFFASSAMSFPSKEGGDSDDGEQFVSAHIVHHRDGSQTVVTKQITTPIAAAAAGSNKVIHEIVAEQYPQVVEAAAPPSVLPITSGNATASLVLGCMAATLFVATYWYRLLLLANIFPVLAIVFGSLALCQIKKSRRQQQEPQQQLLGRWQAITGIVLGSLVGVLHIAILVYLFGFLLPSLGD
jgi:hypothetical protein